MELNGVEWSGMYVKLNEFEWICVQLNEISIEKMYAGRFLDVFPFSYSCILSKQTHKFSILHSFSNMQFLIPYYHL